MPRFLGQSQGGRRFLMGEVPLYVAESMCLDRTIFSATGSSRLLGQVAQQECFGPFQGSVAGNSGKEVWCGAEEWW